jgi:hypothetical protein
MSGGFIQQILSPGGGFLLIPFTRAVLCCLFFTTVSVFARGVARIHMFILSFLSAGMWFSLGLFQKEYSKAMQSGITADASTIGKKVPAKRATVSNAKRED